MKPAPLTPAEMELLRTVFRGHSEISAAKIFGSRANGTHTPQSDVDLALWGELNDLQAEQIASELDDLPLPYRYDVQRFEGIHLDPLRGHIERVGIPIYAR